MIAGVRAEELIFSGIASGACWGSLTGLFVIGMSYDPPAPKRQATTIIVISMAFFAMLAASVHFAQSKIYQNEPDENQPIMSIHRLSRSTATFILTPIAFAVILLIYTARIRKVREQNLEALKKMIRVKPLITCVVSTCLTQLIFTHLFSNGDKPTPLLSKKCAVQCTNSASIAAASVFFASSFF